jgi:hypothetical protein
LLLVNLAPDRSFLRAPGHYRSHISTRGTRIWTVSAHTRDNLINIFLIYLKLKCCFKHIVARMRRLYKTGIGLATGFIGSQYSYSVLHFTTHYCSCNTSGIPCHHLLTLSNRTAALTLYYTRNSLLNCQLTNSADSAISYIAGERTPKKTPF